MAATAAKTKWQRRREDLAWPAWLGRLNLGAATNVHVCKPSRALTCAAHWRSLPICRNTLAANVLSVKTTPPPAKATVCVRIPSLGDSLFFLPPTFSDGILQGATEHPVETVLHLIIDNSESELDVVPDKSVYMLVGQHEPPGGGISATFRISGAATLPQFLELDPPLGHVVRLVVKMR